MPDRPIALFLLLLFSMNVFAADDPPPTGSVHGEIRDALTGRAIDDVTVRLLDGSTEHVATHSANNGRFSFAAVPEGVYSIEVRADGYLTAVQNNARVVLGKVTPATFELVRAGRSMEEMVVTAKAAGRNPLSAANTVRFDREEIRRKPGSGGDVFRALDMLPGVVATGEFSSFTVRGHGPRDNLITIDGIPFDQVVHFDETIGENADSGGRYSIFAPDIVGSAEFSAGGWRAAEGGRFGSLLELEIAEGNPDSPSTGLRVDFAGLEVDYDGPAYIADNTGILFSARDYNFKRLFDAIGEEEAGTPKLTDIIFKSVTELNADHTIDFLAIDTEEDYRRELEDVLESETHEQYEQVDISHSLRDNSLVGVTWRWFPGTSARLRNTLYSTDINAFNTEGEAYPDLAGPAPTMDNTPVRERIMTIRQQQKESGWRSDFSTVLSSGDIFTAGLQAARVELNFDRRLAGDWIRFVYDESDYRPDPAQQYIVLTPERINSAFQARETRLAAYADYTLQFGDMSVTPGVRYTSDGFTDRAHTAPRLAWDWTLDGANRLWATAGVYYQLPRYFDLSADPANTDLKSERAEHVSLGYSHRFDKHREFTVEIYHQRLDDLIVFDDRTRNIATNNGEGDTSGIDLAYIKRMSETTSGSITYSYSRSRRSNNRGGGEYDADYHRPHALSLNGTWEPDDRWTWSIKLTVASGRPTDGYVVHDDVLAPGPLRYSKEYTTDNTDRFGTYRSLSARVDYQHRVGPVSVIAFLDILNVLGWDNDNNYSWNERRGTNDGDGLNTALPLVGLTFEF